MASGFSGGGPDFYNTTGFGARSSTMNMNMNNNNNNPSQQQQQQSPYRSQIFLDPSQISNRTTPNFKRTLSEFQSQYHHHQQQQQHHHHHHQNPALANLFLRSVKPRMYQNISSPISPLSPIDFSPPEIPSLLSQQQQHQRFGMPPLQQLRPQPTIQQITNPTLSGVPYMNSVQQQQQQQQNRVQPQDSEKKMMNQLLALEKQLLDDNDDEEGDAVSVVTNTNSEWSETIQNLISVSSPKPISTSPTSSTTSSSSSSSTVASSPASGCSKQTLMEAASAISEGKTDVANEILTRVGQVSNPMGNSEQKLMEYLLMALKSRGNSFENPPLLAELYSKEHVASTQLLYDLSPCFKLGFMAANHAILEAILDQQPNSSSNNNNNTNKFHVVDFDIGQGGQYVNLLHALSARQNGKQQPPSVVKITAVADNNEGEERSRLRFVGDKLCEVAKKVSVSLKFNVVVVSHKLGDLSRDSLGCEPDELLAVNFAFKLYRMPDESVSTENPRDELLRRVKGLSPRVVTLVEQEMNTNTAPFMARVGEVCSYYGALFDSIESVARDNPDRVKVEEGLGRKLANSVACEGRERVERCEVFGKWRARMGMAGFELKPLSQNVAESMRARLSSGNGVNPGFTVKEENGGVCFGWMGRTLTVASAWR